MRDFRQFTAKGIRELLEEDQRIQFLKIFEKAAESLPKQQYKIWKDDYHPVALISEKGLNEKINYTHFNPVRKGFVEKPEHWKYSSARNFKFSIITDIPHINSPKEINWALVVL